MEKIDTDLVTLAEQIMYEKGLEPVFSEEVLQQVSAIQQPAACLPQCTDLRSLLWCSIDNDDSRDLDQLTYGEKTSDGKYLIWIAVADVAALVQKDSPVDQYAQMNTTSVYTPAKVFSMLPEKLSTDFTSLNEHEDRVAIVFKVKINQRGDNEDFSILQATVRNQAQLTYNSVGEWLENLEEPPEKIKQVPGLEKALRVQHQVAQMLKMKRRQAGALTLEAFKPEAKEKNNHEIVIQLSAHNLAHQLIEEFMIVANKTMATYFSQEKTASLRRVVRVPERWDRIVEIARDLGEELPAQADAIALDRFLIKRKKISPDTFPDLSLAIVKLLGRGEYVVENVNDSPIGHFGLSLLDYTHSTAPNRRFPDLISQRQCKANLKGEESPYSLDELYTLAVHCTQQEDAAMKVERQVNKSAAAILLSSQIGQVFKGLVTGASEKGTWVRLFEPAVEGKIIRGFQDLDTGDKVSVRLIRVDIRKGFIDFEAVSHSH